MSMKLTKRIVVGLLCCLLVQVSTPAGSASPAQSSEPSPNPPGKQSPQELQQLVAPIALYPDALVAQILAASTYPTDIVEADRWLQSNSKLKGKDLADAVDKQPWDPSVKAVTQFPSVLENMDKNLSWTSSLGDAYVNQQQDVMDAVQEMRKEAQKAGHLNSSEQEKVSNQGNDIVIEPANPDVVYVPAYDPWLVYGAPIVAFPGWYPEPGIFFGGPGLSFGIGFGIGFFGGFGWGWGHWGWDWGGHRMLFDHRPYAFHGGTFAGRGGFGHGGGFHGGGPGAAGFHGGAASHAQAGTHSGAFSGYDHGGNVHSFSSRGHSSFGGGSHGGGGFHGGGGGHR